MDDLLLSNAHAFRSLRVFWKRSFIKLDEENAAFEAALLRKNIDHLDNDEQLACNYEATQQQMLSSKLTIEKPDIEGLILQDRNGNGFLNSEMILELGLLHQLTHSEFSATQAFGKWDYLSHQIAASPMKAVDYMDRADVFRYTWISGYDNAFIEKYLVCELKKGKINADEDIRQLMKYVDWVCDEYANGDYSQIEAFLVGSKIGNYDIEALLQLVLRSHLSGHRPPSNEIWNSVSLVTYQAVDSGKPEFERVVDFASVSL